MNEQTKLIENNIKLVYHIVSRQYPTFLHDDDIIQSGMLGLCKAAQTFDAERGVFSTYAGRCIRNEINKEFISRKKFSNDISMETKVNEYDTLGDTLVCPCDTYKDDFDFYDTLTQTERELVKLYQAGFSSREIAEQYHWNITKVQKILRLIKYKRKLYLEGASSYEH